MQSNLKTSSSSGRRARHLPVLALLAITFVSGVIVSAQADAASRASANNDSKSRAKAKATSKAKQNKSFPGSSGSGRQSSATGTHGNGRSNSGTQQGHSSQGSNGRGSGGRVGAASGQNHTGQANSAGSQRPPRSSVHGSANNHGHHGVYRGNRSPVTYRNSVHYAPGVVVYRPRPQRIYVAQAYPAYREVPAAATVQSNVQRDYVSDSVDLGFGLGASYNSLQLQSSVPMLNGKIRVLGQVNDALALGFDLDASSLLWINHATISVVASYDLLPYSNVDLRPYASVGAGFLQVYQNSASFLGPAVSSRVGIELKPLSALGLSLEGGGVAALDQGAPIVVPYIGATMSLYIL